MRGLCPETGAGRRAARDRGWVVVRTCFLRSERADALQLTLELVAIQGSEGQAEEGSATLFDACQGGVERRIPQGFVAIQGGGIGQAPMGLQRCAEIQRAGFPAAASQTVMTMSGGAPSKASLPLLYRPWVAMPACSRSPGCADAPARWAGCRRCMPRNPAGPGG